MDSDNIQKQLMHGLQKALNKVQKVRNAWNERIVSAAAIIRRTPRSRVDKQDRVAVFCWEKKLKTTLTVLKKEQTKWQAKIAAVLTSLKKRERRLKEMQKMRNQALLDCDKY